MYNKEFDQIFALAKNKADDIEILLTKSQSFSVRINQQEIENFSHSDSMGLGIRVIKDGKVGYAYTEELSEAAFAEIIDEAIHNAAVIEKEEPAFMADYPSIDQELDIYNAKLSDVPVADKIALAMQLEATAKELDERIVNAPYCGYGDGESLVKIANSKGLNKEYMANTAYAYIYVLAADGDQRKMAGHQKQSRNFADFDAKKIAAEAVKKATQLLGGDSIKTGTYPVVFDNETMSDLLGTFSGVFSAKSVQEGRSMLKGKLGQQVASPLVSVYDDGLHPDGFASSPCDSEGYPSRKTALIEKGILKSYLHNTETAAKDGVESTGNGARGYKSALAVAPSNFYLQQGATPASTLFKNHSKVIEIVSLQGLHSGANPVSGDFSLGAEGFLWENGKKVGPLKNFTVSGNFLQMLTDTEAIGDNFDFHSGSIGAPAVLIKGLSIGS